MPTRRADRYRQRGQLECGFRVVDGQQFGLSEHWRHGAARFEQDGITFVGTVGGVRFLKRKPVRIVIEHVDRSTQRQPTGMEILAANPAAHVIRIKTATATLEWAMLADQIRGRSIG
jgi:hypothetical protein